MELNPLLPEDRILEQLKRALNEDDLQGALKWADCLANKSEIRRKILAYGKLALEIDESGD